jgi:membrane protease YdiL (CAAX protease family)
MNDMIEKERFSPAMQLAILLIAFGVCYIIGGLITITVASAYLHQPAGTVLSNPKLIEENATLSRILQVSVSFCMFGLPAIIFAFIINKQKGLSVLGFNRAVSGRQVLYAAIIIVAALWVSDALGLLNQIIPVPAHNAAYFKQLEDEYTSQTVTLLDMKDFGGYLMSLFIIGLLPAVLEELIFRACLQKILIGLSKNAFLGIFITSLAFAWIHFSYYGFLSRFFLGIVLGYMFYYSKNIWFNAGFHLINNSIGVTLIYMAVQRGKTVQQAINGAGIEGNLPDWALLAGAAVLAAVVYFVIRLFKKESAQVLAAHAIQPPAEEDTTGNSSTNFL